MASYRSLAVATLAGLTIGAGAYNGHASTTSGVLAAAAGMAMIPFAVEAGCSLMENKRDPEIKETMNGIMGSCLIAFVPAAIGVSLVAAVSK